MYDKDRSLNKVLPLWAKQYGLNYNQYRFDKASNFISYESWVLGKFKSVYNIKEDEKPIKFDEYEATICTHYITAIEYYDISGLNDEEIKQVDKFLALYPNACFQYGEDSYFGRDEISGLMADCIDVTITIFEAV